MDLFIHGLVVGLIGLGIGAMVAQMHGPLGIFKLVRWVMSQPWLPKWVSDNAACIFCWSFYGCVVGALLLGVPEQTLLEEYATSTLLGFGSAVFLLKYTGH